MQKIQGYDHESREAAAAAHTAAPPPREAEEKEGRRSTSFFLPCLRFLCTQEFGGHFFFAFAHFLLYTKDPDLLQALDLPVMPASAGEAVAMAALMAAPLLTAAQGQSHLETHMPASARAAAAAVFA